MKNINITLEGNVPSKKNSKRWVVAGGRRFLVSSEAHVKWHKLAMMSLKSQAVPSTPLEKVSLVWLWFYPPSLRRSDLTNKAESIMDLLVDYGILKDDNWFEVPQINLRLGGKDVKNPRCEIIIEG